MNHDATHRHWFKHEAHEHIEVVFACPDRVSAVVNIAGDQLKVRVDGGLIFTAVLPCRRSPVDSTPSAA